MNPLSKCLGVYFEYNKTQCDQLSFFPFHNNSYTIFLKGWKYSLGIMVQEPINAMLASITDLNTVILPINEMSLLFHLDYWKIVTKTVKLYYKCTLRIKEKTFLYITCI
jgi:hypothetical protein